MTKPLVVTIPHQLGREGAKARLVGGIERLKTTFADKVGQVDDAWTGDHLDIGITVMGQGVRSGLDIEDDHVRVEVQLPWLLAMVAEKARGLIEKEGQLLLENRKK